MRLGIKVFLGDTQECEHLGSKLIRLIDCSSSVSLAAIGVARLAHEKYMSNVVAFRAG